jgi:hypothetical protein
LRIGCAGIASADAAQLRVTALDHNGCPAAAAGTADRIELLPNHLYYLVHRQPVRGF